LGASIMKGFIGRLVIIFCVIISASGIFLLVNRPTGVEVNCSGQITGFGNPNYPLSSFESSCRAEVEVIQNNQTVCSGTGRVRNEQSIITCKGLDNYRGENLNVSSRFYDDSGKYTETSGIFYNGR